MEDVGDGWGYGCVYWMGDFRRHIAMGPFVVVGMCALLECLVLSLENSVAGCPVDWSGTVVILSRVAYRTVSIAPSRSLLATRSKCEVPGALAGRSSVAEAGPVVAGTVVVASVPGSGHCAYWCSGLGVPPALGAVSSGVGAPGLSYHACPRGIVTASSVGASSAMGYSRNSRPLCLVRVVWRPWCCVVAWG